MTRYVAYLRVSTQKQGRSGLGLEAQRAAVARFVDPGDEVLEEFIEVESGKKNARPRLQAALERARAADAVLLIAKLDRLARNVAFIANLLEAGVEIAAADTPQANRFVLHILAAVGEQEAAAISERTKAALAAAKARGARLGWANPARTDLEAAIAASSRARRGRSEVLAATHGPRIAERRAAGLSYAAIAGEFNAQGVAPPRGQVWWASTVRNLAFRFRSIAAGAG